jgi:hypothetical protein
MPSGRHAAIGVAAIGPAIRFARALAIVPPAAAGGAEQRHLRVPPPGGDDVPPLAVEA